MWRLSYKCKTIYDFLLKKEVYETESTDQNPKLETRYKR